MAKSKKTTHSATTKPIDPLQAIRESVEAKLKKRKSLGSVSLLSEGTTSDVREVIPTGIDVIDRYVLGVGGIPVGRLVELFSEPGSGKSSLLYSLLGSVQRMGGNAVLIETERGIDSSRPAVFGCDREKCLCIELDSIEEVGTTIEASASDIDRRVPTLIGFDSVAAATTGQ